MRHLLLIFILELIVYLQGIICNHDIHKQGYNISQR